MIWKSTLREIRQSLGRFIAILAIVAIGVGFFAGLKVTRTAMVETTGQYLEKNRFFDYRLISTLGFEDEEIAFLQAEGDAAAVEGSVTADILYVTQEERTGVVKAHMLTDMVNNVKLLEGRMPEAADECVVDADLFAASPIGQTLTLSEENLQEDLDFFSCDAYKIVGVVQSPYYLQYERGNTSLGNGRVNGFIYLLPEGFAVDYYTEIFVKFQENFDLYSDRYEDFLAEKEPVWEALAKEAGRQRYERLVAEAREEIADGKKELAEEKADAQAELADARRELEDAAAELADAEAELAEGRQEIKDAKQELEDAQREIAENEGKLADARTELAKGEQEIADGEAELAEAWADWEFEQKKVIEGEGQLNAAQAELDANKETLEKQEAALNNWQMLVEMKWAQGQLDGSYTREEYDAETALIAKGRAELEAGKQAVAGAQGQINAGMAQVEDGSRQLSAAYMQIQDSQTALEKAKQELEEARIEIADGERQLAEARQKVADGQKDLAGGQEDLAKGEQEYQDGLAEYEDGLKKYEEGLAEFEQEIGDAEAEIADAQKELSDLESPETYVLGRDTNVGYVCFENDSSIVDGIANIFPVFFFMVAALVCSTTMNRMVEEQRGLIGTLKALGYGRRVIMSKYLFYAGSAAALGCVIGFMGGTWLFPKVIWSAYGIMYRAEEIVYVFDPVMAVISLLAALLCTMGTTYLTCRHELSQTAADLMRPKAPRAGKRVFLERIPFIWKRLGFLIKVSVRNIFRYKKRLFMMIIGISGCTALLVTGFGIKDSIAHIAQQQFSEIQLFDLSVTLSEPLTPQAEDKLRDLAGKELEGLYPLQETTMDLTTDNGRKAVNLVVAEGGEDIASYLNLHNEKKEQLPYPGKGEVVLTDKVAGELGVGTGDTVLLQDEDRNTLTLTVSGTCRNFIYNYAYINEATYEEQMGKAPERKAAWLNVSEEADVHQISAALMQMDKVANVTVNLDTQKRFDSMMASLDLIVVFIILCAGCLAFIVLYNLTNINITERVREIATIKVLGFYKNETAAYVFRENVALTFMGAIVGLPLGSLLHSFVMNRIQIDMAAFDTIVTPLSYFLSAALTVAFAGVINGLMGPKLGRVSMTESLKSVD